MTIYFDQLPPVYNLREAPFRWYDRDIAGDDQIRIGCGTPKEDVPNIWQLEWLKFTLTTDATVANRNIKFWITGKTNNTGAYTSPNITASSTERLAVGNVALLSTGVTFSDHHVGLTEMPKMFGDDMNLGVQVVNGVAGDVLNVWALFRFLNREMRIFDPVNVDQIPTPPVVIPPDSRSFPPPEFR